MTLPDNAKYEYQVFRKSTKEYAYCGFSIKEAAELDMIYWANRNKEPLDNYQIHIFLITKRIQGIINAKLHGPDEA